MTDRVNLHHYQIGEAVLACVNRVPVPGVIVAEQDGKLLVHLAEPWVNEAGESSDEAWLTPDKLDPAIEEETGGTEALPG